MQKIKRIHFEKLDSTISWVKDHYQEFDPSSVICVTASTQTAGKGRFSRKWVSTQGNLHMTLFYSLEKGDPRVANLAQLMALAICSLFPAKIKWPNDIVVDEKKLGGILVEIIDCEDRLGIIHSLGLNVNAPVKTDQKTTSLFEWTGKKHDLDPLIDQIVTAYFKQLEQGFSAEAFNKKLAYRGEPVTCQIGMKSIHGTLVGVDEEGKLQLLLDDGTIRSIYSGDLTT